MVIPMTHAPHFRKACLNDLMHSPSGKPHSARVWVVKVNEEYELRVKPDNWDDTFLIAPWRRVKIDKIII